MTKPTATYLQLPTLRRLAPHLTPQIGLDSLINRLCDAAGYGAADPYPVTTTRDAQAVLVSSHGYSPEYDLNGDLTVNPGDQALAAALGMPQSAPVTPPPTSIVGEMIKSVDGTPHEHLVPGVGTDWDFYAHGVIQKGNPGTSKGVSLWASFQDIDGQTATIETRNPQLWAIGGLGDHWTRVLPIQFMGSQIHPTPPHEGGVIGDMGSGPTFTKPGGKGSQMFSWQATLPAGCVGVVAFYEVRALAGKPLVDCGADCWPVSGSSSGNQGLCVGRYILPDATWRVAACSSVPASVLQQHPPPV